MLSPKILGDTNPVISPTGRANPFADLIAKVAAAEGISFAEAELLVGRMLRRGITGRRNRVVGRDGARERRKEIDMNTTTQSSVAHLRESEPTIEQLKERIARMPEPPEWLIRQTLVAYDRALARPDDPDSEWVREEEVEGKSFLELLAGYSHAWGRAYERHDREYREWIEKGEESAAGSNG